MNILVAQRRKAIGIRKDNELTGDVSDTSSVGNYLVSLIIFPAAGSEYWNLIYRMNECMLLPDELP